MDDSDILFNAKRKLEMAEAEAMKWRSFIEMLSELSDAPRIKRERLLPKAQRVGTPVTEGKLTATERVAGQVIHEAKRPVPSPEMLQRLEERGITIGGKDKASTMAARLSRAPTLVFLKGLGWSLREEKASDAEAPDAEMPAQIGT